MSLEPIRIRFKTNFVEGLTLIESTKYDNVIQQMRSNRYSSTTKHDNLLCVFRVN